MKLLSLLLRYQLAASLALAAAGFAVAWLAVDGLIREEQREHLAETLLNTAAMLDPYAGLPAEEELESAALAIEFPGGRVDSLKAADVWPGAVRLVPGTAPAQWPARTVWEEENRWVPEEEEWVPHLVVTLPVKTGNGWAALTAASSTHELRELETYLYASFGCLLAVLLGAQTLLLYQAQRRLWRPFFGTLQQARTFSVRDAKPLAVPRTPILEFQDLQHTLLELTQQAEKDYRTLGAFTENASHEMNTPLAVMQAELEAALQAPGLGGLALERLAGVQAALSRLRRLHTGLLELTRIENGLHPEPAPFDMAQVLRRQVAFFAERLEAKGFETRTDAPPSLLLAGVEPLAELLLGAVLANVLQHGVPTGPVSLELDARRLAVSNNAPRLAVPARELLGRFRKGDAAGATTGLGLSIAQAAAAANGWRIEYVAEGTRHTVTVWFAPTSVSLQDAS